MTDRELLELAAKAAGIEEGIGGAFWTKFGVFDPLADDGDALRLAVKLQLTVEYFGDRVEVTDSSIAMEKFVNNNGDPYAATRRAIVRAAAEIGKAMEKVK